MKSCTSTVQFRLQISARIDTNKQITLRGAGGKHNTHTDIISSSIRLEQESDNDFYQTALQSQIKPPRLFPQVAQSVFVLVCVTFCVFVCVCVRTGEVKSIRGNPSAAHVGGFGAA